MPIRFARDSIQQLSAKDLRKKKEISHDSIQQLSGKDLQKKKEIFPNRGDPGVAAADFLNANADKFSPARSCEPQQPLPQEYFYYLRESESSEEQFTTSEDEERKVPAPPKEYFEDVFRLKTLIDIPAAPSVKYTEYLFKDDVLDYRCFFNIKSRKNRIKVNQWVDTWKEVDVDGRSWTWIHVHAYYSTKKRHGGYGVILRDALGKPITAAAKFSKTGVSFYYQVFKGINVGVKLAEDRNLSDLRVRCNSVTVPNFFRRLSDCKVDQCKTAYVPGNDRCNPAYDPRKICTSCKSNFIAKRREVVMPLAVKLRHKKLRDLGSSAGDPASHYVAKMEKMKILEVEKEKEPKMVPEVVKKEESSATSDGAFSPDVFPRGLKNILWIESLHKLW